MKQTENNMLKMMTQDYSALDLTTGVPQGSILGHPLFIIYMTDIAQAFKMFGIIIYANDTTISSIIRTTAESDLTKVISIIGSYGW